MGIMIDGKWTKDNPKNKDGAFERIDSVFQGSIDQKELIDDPKRFDLYVSLACPWAHRTLIFRKLKGLERYINVHEVEAYMGENGWSFSQAEPNISAKYLSELYAQHEGYTGKVTVPVLWDKHTNRIRCNESAVIISMINSMWDHVADYPDLNFIPEERSAEITALNDLIYEKVNNAVYRTGFATDQKVYEEECQMLFATLDELEKRLEGRQYLLGDDLLEPDIRLFTTLLRFDWVYFGHFKCNVRMLESYENLFNHMKRIYNQVEDTIDRKHIQAHYYTSHPWINPNGIVPIGPETDYHK